MEAVGQAKVIRIKSCHLQEIANVYDLQDALNFLNSKAFMLAEESSDGFFVTYENPDFVTQEKNTLVYFNSKGYFMDVNYFN